MRLAGSREGRWKYRRPKVKFDATVDIVEIDINMIKNQTKMINTFNLFCKENDLKRGVSFYTSKRWQKLSTTPDLAGSDEWSKLYKTERGGFFVSLGMYINYNVRLFERFKEWQNQRMISSQK